MDPPAYTPTRRSIQDLRAQIIANGTVIRPRKRTDEPSEYHIELIVAKTPALASAEDGARKTHFRDANHAIHVVRGGRQMVSKSGGESSSSPATAGDGKHYAVLLKRNLGSKTIKIIMRGELKDTVEEALEWMLHQTELLVHDLVVQNGKIDDDGCSLM